VGGSSGGGGGAGSKSATAKEESPTNGVGRGKQSRRGKMCTAVIVQMALFQVRSAAAAAEGPPTRIASTMSWRSSVRTQFFAVVAAIEL
jgi:hypothetical protein